MLIYIFDEDQLDYGSRAHGSAAETGKKALM